MRIALFIIISLIGIGIAYYMIRSNEHLSVYNPDVLNEDLVDSSLQDVMSGHRIASFKLINQNGETITDDDFKNKIYVTDFFFTTCPGICPKMSAQMERVQEANINREDFRILSHTVQPEVDSPEVLLKYARKHHADPRIWQFATGTRKNIYQLARKSYFTAMLEEGDDEDKMVHSENFILVDKEKRIRGIYDGTSVEEVDRLIADIEILRRSYD